MDEYVTAQWALRIGSGLRATWLEYLIRRGLLAESFWDSPEGYICCVKRMAKTYPDEWELLLTKYKILGKEATKRALRSDNDSENAE